VALLVGSNNLGGEVCEVYWALRAVVSAVHAKFPRARIFLFSIVPAGDHFQDRADKKAALNAMLKANAGTEYVYVDISGPLQAACDHQASCALYQPGNIHLNQDGFALLTNVLRNAVAQSERR
jgi:hypothetical protein